MSLATVTSPTLRNLFASAEELGVFGDTDYEDYKLVYPHCPVRMRYASTLTYYALGYMAHHEISHVLNGHIEYLETLPAPTNDDERSARALLSQTLEYDADATAIATMIDCAETIANTNPEYSLLSVLADMARAMHATMMFFQESMTNHAATARHPAPRVRQWLSYLTLAHQVDARGIERLSVFGQLVAPQVLDIELGYMLVTGRSGGARQWYEAHQHPFVNQKIECWNRIYPDLLRHAYVRIDVPESRRS